MSGQDEPVATPTKTNASRKGAPPLPRVATLTLSSADRCAGLYSPGPGAYEAMAARDASTRRAPTYSMATTPSAFTPRRRRPSTPASLTCATAGVDAGGCDRPKSGAAAGHEHQKRGHWSHSVLRQPGMWGSTPGPGAYANEDTLRDGKATMAKASKQWARNQARVATGAQIAPAERNPLNSPGPTSYEHNDKLRDGTTTMARASREWASHQARISTATRMAPVEHRLCASPCSR